MSWPVDTEPGELDFEAVLFFEQQLLCPLAERIRYHWEWGTREHHVGN